MPNKTRGVGLFTAENIVAVLRAIPESDGTYRDVARQAEQYGSKVQYHTISNWASHQLRSTATTEDVQKAHRKPSSNERAGKNYRSPATPPRTSTAVMRPVCCPAADQPNRRLSP